MTKATIGTVTKAVQESDCRIALTCDRAVGQVTGITPTIVRVQLTTYGRLLDDHSYAVEAQLPRAPLTLSTNDDELVMSTSGARVILNRRAFALSLSSGAGNILTAGLPVTFTHDSIEDRRCAVPDEEFYGLGTRTSPLGRRGYIVRNWNTDGFPLHAEQTYSSFPFYVSANARTGACYGYFLDSPYKSSFDMGQGHWDTVSVTVEHAELKLYLFTAQSVPEIIRDYTMLTGRHAMPPIWATGYHQCRWGYRSTAEVREVADTLRAKNIPCDVLWYDIDYMDTFRVFTFNAERFGDMKAHAEEMAAKGFKRIVIVDPGVKVDDPGVYPVCDEGTQNGYFIKHDNGKDYEGKVWPGGTRFPDFSRPEVRAWWGKLHAFYYDHGVNAFWNDMNEPADGSNETRTIPNHLTMADDGRHSSMRKMHNVYALLEAKATWEDAMLAMRPNERPFLLTRAAFAGIQKYSAMWGGDNNSEWEYLKRSIAASVNMGLSGVGFFGSDVGGFGGNCTPEMLARWTQLGVFYPFFRNHACAGTSRQEPWAFGPEVEEICHSAIELRYHLLPYVYQLFRELHVSGTPLTRPLFWHYPADCRTYQLDDQFMFGRYIIAAPVAERGARCRVVYLPEGRWVHYLSGETYEGGRDYAVDAPLDSIPLFVRAGSVLPVMPVVQTTDHWNPEVLTLEVFAGESPFEERYYEDDLRTNAYTNGAFCESDISLRAGELRVSLHESSAVKRIVVRVRGEAAAWRERVFERTREIRMSV